jgi:V/A-type H+-transporting ATPase subunit F
MLIFEANMEAKVAVLGGSDFVMAFSALGLDGFAVESQADIVADKAEEILKLQYGLIVVAENIAEMADVVFSRTQRDATPCVVVVPFMKESEGFATKSLGRLLKLATGIDILAN